MNWLVRHWLAACPPVTLRHLRATERALQEALSRYPMMRSEEELPRRKKIPSSSSAPAGLNGLRGRRIEDGPILVGICAMDQKARAAPMTEMLNRLTSFTASGLVEFKVVYFGNETLLNQPVEEWPLCEALIAFYSTGFPLQKAQEYVALRRPLVFNDLQKQELLFDRRETYRILQERVHRVNCTHTACACTLRVHCMLIARRMHTVHRMHVSYCRSTACRCLTTWCSTRARTTSSTSRRSTSR